MLNEKILQDIIEDQASAASYNGLDCTRVHRLCAYEAFSQLLTEYPTEMIGYLNESKRGHNFQSQLFQIYIKILEERMPFSYFKNDSICHINSLLSDTLGIFDGISVFRQQITEKGIIKNATVETYSGGRKATYHRPYFIGKVLDIVNVENHTSLLSMMSSYSFSEIKMKKEMAGRSVLVSHLRITPHYQMGGMVYINRARKDIVAAI